MSNDPSAVSPGADPPPTVDYSRKWLAFGAIAISFVTMVMSISMVFVALAAIADDFGVTLRAVSWVVIAQALTISALMMPMGRLADIIGWKRVHLIGLVLFGGGAVAVAFAPTFGLLILARVIMAVGNAMGQSVGTAIVVSVFPPEERGKAIGSQTTAVAIGGASGPIIAGLVLQVLPWEALFLLLVVPISIAFVAGYWLLDDRQMQPDRETSRPSFDWGGAVLSGLAITLLVLVINNPRGDSWTSPIILGGIFGFGVLMAAFVRWELRTVAPMLDLRFFRNRTFSLAVITRLLGFMGTTATRFLMPIYLISLRGLEEGAAGAILFLMSFGMGISAQVTGRLTDRFGPRPFAVMGFVVLLATSLPMAFFTADTMLAAVLALLFLNGLGMGLWNVPNNSMIIGSVPASNLGVVGAFSNLTRNGGNVIGQAVAAGVIAAVMAASGFDIPLSAVATTPGADQAFFEGWRVAYFLVTAYAAIGLAFAIVTKPNPEPATSSSEERPAAGVSRR